MDTLQTMRVFVRVAQSGGFAAAARELRMSPSAVTKHVSALEERIGVRLFDRTTRRVAVTEAGRIYLERCLEALQAFEDADFSVSELAREPAGLLRVTAPTDLQQHVSPVVGRFMKANPRVLVDLNLSNRPVDLVDEGFDLAVRVAPSLDGAFVARPLARTHMGAFAAPSYLTAHGRPRRPGDLTRYRSLVFVEPRPRDSWTLEKAGRQVTVKLATAMLSNSARALQMAAVEGAGLLVCPRFSVLEELAAGTLEPVLEDWKILPDLHVYAIYPHRRFLSAKVRAFVDALRQEFREDRTGAWRRA